MDDRDRMERSAPWLPWALTSLALVAVAAIAYGVGAHGEAGALATEPVRWRHGGFGGIWPFFVLFWIFGGLRWLTIARGLVEAHGGAIHAQSRLGAGTTIAFSLPR